MDREDAIDEEGDSEMTPCHPEESDKIEIQQAEPRNKSEEERADKPDVEEQKYSTAINDPIEDDISEEAYEIDEDGVVQPLLGRNKKEDKDKVEPVKVFDCPFSINAETMNQSLAESILENQPEGSEIGLLPESNEEVNCKTMHADIAREIFLHLRLRLAEELKN